MSWHSYLVWSIKIFIGCTHYELLFKFVLEAHFRATKVAINQLLLYLHRSTQNFCNGARIVQ